MKTDFEKENNISKISPELVRIVAHICGDGYVCTGNQTRCKSELIKHLRRNMIRKKYYIRYVNKEPILINQFTSDVKNEFNRSVIHLRRWEHEISGKKVYDLITSLGAGKSHKWFIADVILKGENKNKIEWIRAFFDDEAHVSKNNKSIVLNCVNENGLKQIQGILNEFGISCKLNGPYFYKGFYSYHLNIYRNFIKKYFDLIGFYHPKKIRDLSEIVSNLK